MPLTEVVIRQVQPDGKAIKPFDGRGLYLLLSPNGSRWWRFKYRFDGREKLLSFGIYPDVPLRLAREWLAMQEPKLAPATYATAVWKLETLIFPGVGKRPIGKITAPDLLAVLRKIKVRGTNETAHRAKQRCGQVFRYAIATGRAVHDITADLRGALAPVVTANHAAIIEPERVGELLRAIHGYRGNAATRYALKIAALSFVRLGERRRMTQAWADYLQRLQDGMGGDEAGRVEAARGFGAVSPRRGAGRDWFAGQSTL